MKDKKIFSSGYFSMKGVLDIFVDMGYKVYTTYKEELSGVEGAEYVHFAHDVDLRTDRGQYYIDLAEVCMSNISVGGVPLATHDYTRQFMLEWFIKSFFSADYIIEEYKKLGKMDMVIVHNDHDPTYGGLSGAARQDGVPVFCLYNGFSAFLHPIMSGMQDYRFGAHYCLNGQYVLDYLKERTPPDFKGAVTGCPAWDLYYEKEENREPNTFLYNPTVNYEEIEMPEDLGGGNFLVPTGVHPWTYMLRPPQTDHLFYEAFVEYQKKVNPDAKLWITMRPFHLAGNSHADLARKYGIKNVTGFLHRDRPFRDLLLECDYYVSGISTTIQEAIITRTPTVLLCGKEPAEDFFMQRDCYVETIIKPKPIVEALTVVTQEKDALVEACNDKAEYYNYGDDGKASERAVEYMLEVVNG